MDNAILRGDSWLGDVVVAELNCVRVEGGIDLLIGNLIAEVVLEVGTSIETLLRADF